MGKEIRIAKVLFATACDGCKGTGWTKTYWASSRGGGMTLVEEVKCEKCFRGTGWVLTENGYAMCAFIELINK